MTKNNNKETYYLGSCHCGKIKFQLNETPQWLVKCNCSICSKIASKWAHSHLDNVELNYNEDDSIRYIWGDKSLAIISCRHCGNTTHWEGLDPINLPRVGLNFRLCSASDISEFRIRHFDGADSWEFLD